MIPRNELRKRIRAALEARVAYDSALFAIDELAYVGNDLDTYVATIAEPLMDTTEIGETEINQVELFIHLAMEQGTQRVLTALAALGKVHFVRKED
jgi:hypothetical protein